MTINLQHLSNTSLDAPLAPFCLTMQDGSILSIESIVRKVPNKRLVCKGVWNKQRVYAKLFVGEDANKYAARDQAGVMFLHAANIATPTLIFVGELQIILAKVLIFADLANAINAEVAYTQLDEKARFNLATLLVAEVAKHHNAGLIQTDLYLKNFLAEGDKIITLDGDGIRQFTALSNQQAIQNLCVLLSKFDALALENWLPKLMETYTETSARQNVPDTNVIKAQVNQHRRHAASQYADKKVFRTCADVKVYAPRGIFYAVAGTYKNIDLPTNITDLDALITLQNIIKNGNTCTVAITQFADKKIVIKRYNIKSFWHGISRALRPSRAAVSWANAHRLSLLGIATAMPVAVYESRRLGLRGKAFFLTEYIESPDAAVFFMSAFHKTQRATAVKNIVTLFYRLYLLQISHGDTKATNIKIVDCKPVLIDLDSMRQHSTHLVATQAHVRDLMRFMQNWQNDIPLYNAFVKTFKVVYPDITVLEKAGIAINKEIVTT